MAEIESGIFDIGGVLVNNRMPYVKEDIAKTLGIDKELFKQVWDETSPLLGNGQISETQFWQTFINKTKTTQPLPEESLLLREYARKTKPDPKMFRILTLLKSKQIKLAVLSNTIGIHVEYLTQQGFLENFQVRIFSNEVGMSKPDPNIYILTLEKLNSRPKETFFVDDNKENVEAARNLGINSILFISPREFMDELENLKALP